jgi:pimeloyl-ACP methyl ester carboxylesterase
MHSDSRQTTEEETMAEPPVFINTYPIKAGKTGEYVRANDIDIHYIDAGPTDAPTLVLLHGGLVSTSEIWASTPISYASHLRRLAEEFHIIAPDARGSAMTTHSGGPVSMSMLADDVAGLIDGPGLGRPAVAGFSEAA